MARTADLFPETKPPRQKPRRLMRVIDAGSFPDGQPMIECECFRCGYNTGQIVQERPTSECKRGLPCPKCNPTP